MEDERVKRLFEEHCRAMNNDVSPAALTSTTNRSVDLLALASRHASEVTDREYAERSNIFLDLQRRIESDGTAEALFKGEVVPLPRSDFLDHVLANEEIEVQAALAFILRVRLQERVAAPELAQTIGNFAPVAPIVAAELPGADDRERLQLSRLLMKAEIDALQRIVNDATEVEIAAPHPSTVHRRLKSDEGQPDQQTTKADEGQALSVVAKEWITEKGRTNAWVEKTRHEREAAVRTFIEICGDRPIGAYLFTPL